jgi:hypothetical protein
MYLLSAVSVVLSLSSSVLSSPTGNSRRDASFKSSVVEKLNGPPVGWTMDDSIEVDKDVEMVKLRIHLVQQGMDKFHDMAMKVRRAILLLSLFQRTGGLFPLLWGCSLPGGILLEPMLSTSSSTCCTQDSISDILHRLLLLGMIFMEVISPNMSSIP